MLDNVAVEVGDGSPVDTEALIETSADGDAATTTKAAQSAPRNWVIRIAGRGILRGTDMAEFSRC